MKGHRPNEAALDLVIQAYEDSAVEGAIGSIENSPLDVTLKKGINLHVYIDQEVTHDQDLFMFKDEIANLNFNNDFKSIKDRHVGFSNIQTTVTPLDTTLLGPSGSTGFNNNGDAVGTKKMFLRGSEITSHVPNAAADSGSSGGLDVEGTAVFTVQATFEDTVETVTVKGKPQPAPCDIPIDNIEVFKTVTFGATGGLGSTSPGVRASAHPTDDPKNWVFIVEIDFSSSTGQISSANIGEVIINLNLLDAPGGNIITNCVMLEPLELPAGGQYATSNVIQAHAQLFSYVIFGHTMAGFDDNGKVVKGCGGPSGMFETPGNDGAITLGCDWGGPDDPEFTESKKHTATQGSLIEQAGTFMHELGHGKGLLHNGPAVVGKGQTLTHNHIPTTFPFFSQLSSGILIPGTSTGCVPTHISVMSYTRQTENPTYVGDTKWNATYSHGEFPLLIDETNVLETPISNDFDSTTYKLVFATPEVKNQDVGFYKADGIDAPDWNQKGGVDSDIDLNNFGIPGCGESLGSSGLGEVLVDVDEWTHLNYDLRNVAGGAFNSEVQPHDEATKDIGHASGPWFDGLLKWHGLNGPEPLSNTVTRGDFINIGFQYLTCSGENNPNRSSNEEFVDTCIDTDGIIMQTGFYNEQPTEEFVGAEGEKQLELIVLGDREGSDEILGNADDEFFFIRVSQITGVSGGLLENSGFLEEFGESGLAEDKFFFFPNGDFGGFYNFFFDTSLLPDLPGVATYAVDIIHHRTLTILIDHNDEDAHSKTQIITNSQTDDPDETGAQGFRNNSFTTFILTVEAAP